MLVRDMKSVARSEWHGKDRVEAHAGAACEAEWVWVQADAGDAEDSGNTASALLAASQASAQLKASQLQEQQLVITFLHHFCEKVSNVP